MEDLQRKMSSTTPTTSATHGMTLRDRSPKPKTTGTTSTADNKTNKACKPSKTAKSNKANKVTKNTNTNAASKNNKASKLDHGALHLWTEGVTNPSTRSGKEQNAGIEITVAVSEEFEFLKWTKGMMFRNLKFAKEMGMEMDEGEFRKKWDNEE
ncbi:hypothetical protein FPQ18DRAFT_389488 [Pyronema domesticum]|nr:hypothetical protein FPQ18DRAFT_389488 [Pyronema domesticum]